MRSRNSKRREIGEWPDDEQDPEGVSEQVEYRGSPEHKTYPSQAGPPALRPDATKCSPDWKGRCDELTEHLKEGILHRCVSERFEEGFPRYVWTWVDGELYEARHIRGPSGTYKGYKLKNRAEWPKDPENRLDW